MKQENFLLLLTMFLIGVRKKTLKREIRLRFRILQLRVFDKKNQSAPPVLLLLRKIKSEGRIARPLHCVQTEGGS